MQIRTAAPADDRAITALINLAFQIERFFVHGDRIAIEEVQRRLTDGTFFLAEDAEGLAGCVYVELHGERAYLGLLSVDPARQGSGIGTRLMSVGEDYARQNGSRFMDLLIVSLREELPGFYTRLGYIAEGTSPFSDPARLKQPCHFVKMSKPLIDAIPESLP